MVPSWVNSSGARSAPPPRAMGISGLARRFCFPGLACLLPPLLWGKSLLDEDNPGGEGCGFPVNGSGMVLGAASHPSGSRMGFLRRGTRFLSENPPVPGRPCLHAGGSLSSRGERGCGLVVLGETEARCRAELGSALTQPQEVAGMWLRQHHRAQSVPWWRGRAEIWGGTRRGPQPAWLSPVVPSWAAVSFPALAAWHGGGNLCPSALAGTLGDRTLRLGTPRAQLLARSRARLDTPTAAKSLQITPNPSPRLPPFAGFTGSVIACRPQGCRYPGAAPFLSAVP